MLTHLDIHGFRGIQQGSVTNLRQVTLVTGANAAGKTALLEALYVGAHPDPARALADLLDHAPVGAAHRFLAHASEPGGTVKLRARTATEARGVAFAVRPQSGELEGPAPHARIDLSAKSTAAAATGSLATAADNRSKATWKEAPPALLPAATFLRPIDDFSRAWSDATLAGHSGAIIDRVRRINSHVDDLQMVIDKDGLPRLYALSGAGDMPLALAGSGLMGFAGTVLGLVGSEPGLVLLDEPCPDAHPSTLWELARLVWDLSSEDRQIVVATQRLDLIDAIIGTASRSQGEHLCLRRLALSNGLLAVSAIDGDDVAFARNLVEDDLR